MSYFRLFRFFKYSLLNTFYNCLIKCTDDDSVIDYYSDFDMLLEQPIEVLDDFRSEAMEIYRVNPWLNYGLILHRSR